MNPLAFFTRPVTGLFAAVAISFKAIFVVALCFAINAFTSPGAWWAQWVAFGMGIAVFVAWARVVRDAGAVIIVGLVSAWLYKRFGADARAKFDAWRTARAN